ncbi:hypothetical protein ABPG75_007028 [Micractinium tetrahymenae]
MPAAVPAACASLRAGAASWRATRARRHAACRSAGGQQGEQATSTPLDVLRNDLHYLEGLDMAAREAHDEVVAVLNPIAGEAMTRQLEEQIAGLQQELAQAHTQIHRTEGRLRGTVQNLTELEQSVRSTFGSASDADLVATRWDAAGAAAAASSSAAASTATAAAAAGITLPARPAAAPARQGAALRRRRQGRDAGLSSVLAIPEQLKDYWFPVEFSASLGEGKMVPFELFGQMWVLFRDESGRAACVHDECAHRACPLSLGTVEDGRVQCAYHGWQFNSRGECTKMPSTAFCKGIKVQALPVVESDGLVWVWPGSEEARAAAGPPPSALTSPPSGFQVHAELVLEVSVEHGLLLENLLDLAHAPFTHTTTFAKGWPVPDVVRFNAAQILGGNWEPYPIDMQFGPPCMVLSTIGLTSPGKIERGARASSCKNHLHQLHVCLPSSEGRTRLLYRMSLDFLHWTKAVPGINKFWEKIAGQVLGEDLVLVQGQQDRMSRGGDVWANPVSYDKLGVRYRRWRNSVASGDPAARAQAEAGLQPLSAGEIFAQEAAAAEAEPRA